MNPVALVHVLASSIVIGISVPLIRRKVPMNHFYGVRTAEAFASDAAWFDINEYGGRVLRAWGIVFAVTAAVGLFVPRRDWLTYDFASLVPILGGLAIVVVKIHLYARRRKSA
jgi:hypothetical protein